MNDDLPISNIKQDELGRNRLVHQITRAIEDKIRDSHHAVTIGVYGAWGEGKTSLMKMVKSELETNGHESSWYNPWAVNDERKLLMEFFSILSSAAYDDNDVKVAIENYGNSFFLANDTISYNPVTASYLTRLSHCIPSEGKDIEKLKNSISDRLKSKKKHPIIFIDDTDRLNSHEIRTIFKLIRQIADFENVIYIIGLDPTVVSESLELSYSSRDEDNYSKGRSFLEKVIQIPIVLPVVDEAIILKLIKTTIFSVAKEFEIKVDKKSVGIIADKLSSVLTTKRSIIRFGNQLRFVLPSIYEETELVDLCLVESLKYLNEQGWSEIYRQKNNLLGLTPLSVISDTEKAKYRKESYDKSIKSITSFYPAETRKYVEDILVTRLFPERLLNFININSNSKTIHNRLYFGQYFISGVPEGIIPRIETDLFARLVQTNQKKAISWINQMYKTYSSDEVNRSARLALNSVADNNIADTAAKLCVILSFSNLSKKYSNNLITNPTYIDVTITSYIIPNYFIRNVQGIRVKDNELVTKVLKEIYEKASINYCLNLFYGVYSGDCILPDDEMGVFDVLKHRVLEHGGLAIFDYSYSILQRFLKVWKKLDTSTYITYIKSVLNNEKFNAGAFVVDCLKAVSQDDQLTTISAITFLFMDVWDEFNKKLNEYEDKENKLFKLYVFNCETSRENLKMKS